MIITICSSYKFKDKIEEVYKELAADRHIVMFPNFDCGISDKETLFEIHFKKIKMSDAIFVVDIDGVIGESVAAEIAYARTEGKKVIRYSELKAEEFDPIRDCAGTTEYVDGVGYIDTNIINKNKKYRRIH